MPFLFSFISLLASSWNHQSNYSLPRFDSFLSSFSKSIDIPPQILSIVYAFVMLAVLVATTSQIIMESESSHPTVPRLTYRIPGVLAPTSLFIVTMVGIFAGAALLHPQECSNIVHGTVFFLLIPSTYVFLSLYSLINLNVINWGTREAVAKAMGKVFPSLSS